MVMTFRKFSVAIWKNFFVQKTCFFEHFGDLKKCIWGCMKSQKWPVAHICNHKKRTKHLLTFSFSFFERYDPYATLKNTHRIVVTSTKFFSMLKVILYLTKTLFFQRMYVGFTFFVGTKSRDFSDGCPDFHRREKVFCSFPPCNRSSVGLLYDHVCPQKQTAWSYDIWKQFYGSKRLKLVIFEDWYPFGHPEPSAQKNEQLPIFGLLFQLQVLLKTFLCISKAWYGYLKQSSEVEL